MEESTEPYKNKMEVEDVSLKLLVLYFLYLFKETRRMRKCIFVLLILSLSLLFQVTVLAKTPTAYLDESSNRTMVPLRFVSEQLGATVLWNNELQIITIVKDGLSIQLVEGNPTITLNDAKKRMDAPPIIIDNVTFVPIRFISEAIGATVSWNEKTSSAVIDLHNKQIVLPIGEASSPTSSGGQSHEASTSYQETFKVGSKSIKAEIVTVDMRHNNVELNVALAKDKVGEVESLKSIAARKGAQIAINGTFFDAYTVIKEPYGLIIRDGEVVHAGSDKTAFYFDKANNLYMDVLNTSIKGGTNGSYKWPNNWYAYWLNRTPSENGSAVVILKKARGSMVGFDYGTNIVVENGVITDIKAGDVAIPANGYIINLTGSEKDSLIDRFKVGNSAEFRVDIEGQNGSNGIDGALGVGPRLVKDGKVAVNFEKEGFTSEKILTNSAARSAIGIKKDGTLLLLTTRGATIYELAEIMLQAGAYQAMNLDGGASSGLYYHGTYITQPGRDISNALLIYE